MCAGSQADLRADEQQICAHAQSIVLTENAVGFENGGQRVPSNRETDPLYVSKAATRKAPRRPLRRGLTCTCARAHRSHSSTLARAVETWCFFFSRHCDSRTSLSKTTTATRSDSSAGAGNADAFNRLESPTRGGGKRGRFSELCGCFKCPSNARLAKCFSQELARK